MQFLKNIFITCVLLLPFLLAASQNIDVSLNEANKLLSVNQDTAAAYTIHQVNISGNNKTKLPIIQREIQLRKGDTVLFNAVNGELQRIRQQVYNTNLFTEVKVEIDNISDSSFDINVAVKERWYIFPLLKFQLVDRNINEWLKKYNGDLGRVVYGVKFTHYNLTGRRDIMRVMLLNGFTRNASLSYFIPLSNKDLTQGFSFAGGYVENKEFIYKTAFDNKPVHFNNGGFSRKNIFAGIGFNYRKNILSSNYFNITYNHNPVPAG